MGASEEMGENAPKKVEIDEIFAYIKLSDDFKNMHLSPRWK